jgi:hypothetical protein
MRREGGSVDVVLPAGSRFERTGTEGACASSDWISTVHLNLPGSGLHDGSDVGAGTDLRGRPSLGTLCLPPRRNARQAVVEVEELLFRGHPDVADTELADYYGSIPHADLLNSIGPRIVDRRVLHLIRMWLDCPVEETDNRGRKTRTTEARDKRRGTPQGSADLPLAGEYLHAPVRAGMEDVRVRVNLGHAARDLRRPRDPV